MELYDGAHERGLSMISVVMVEPETAENVGFVARTLACYHLTDLRIVGSWEIAGEEAARRTGKSALDVLARVKRFGSLAEAVADCQWGYGFTARPRNAGQVVEELSAAAAEWRRMNEGGGGGKGGSTALVFGRESRGLFKEETLQLSHLVRIPLAEETLSLNVSHAVAIGLYAFCGSDVQKREPSDAAADRASLGDSEKVLAEWGRLLTEVGFLKPGKAEAQRDYLRTLWQRLGPSQGELHFLEGLVRRLGSRTSG